MAEQNGTVATTTVDTAAIDTSGQAQQQTEPEDYKTLYEQMLAEKNNLKGQVDKYSSEIKKYKQGEKDKMSESERLQSDLAESRKATADLEAKIAKIQSEKVFADKGFKPEEYNVFIEAMSEFGTVTEDNAVKLANAIVDSISKRVAVEKQQYENAMTANNTVKTATSTTETKTDDFAEMRAEQKRLTEQRNQKITF